jgi:hypothetical protein
LTLCGVAYHRELSENGEECDSGYTPNDVFEGDQIHSVNFPLTGKGVTQGA